MGPASGRACLTLVLQRADLLRRDPAAAEPAAKRGEGGPPLATGHTSGGGRAAGRGGVFEVVDRRGRAHPSRERSHCCVPVAAATTKAAAAPPP